MYKMGIMLLIAVLAAGPVTASDKTDVMAVIHQWVDSFNKGDEKAALATCADEGSIIDDIEPHEWHGSGMCSHWMESLHAWVAKNEISETHVTAGRARHVDLNGAHAYVVLPMTFAYKDHGKPMKQTGSLATMSLTKSNSGWRISGWAWADGVTTAASADGGQ
jgi:ketosteroid isomerase-like protein